MTDRQYIERDPSGGRRLEDKQKCPNCDILWQHHDNDRKEHREAICREIKELKKEIGIMEGSQSKAHSSFVPRWMFLMIFGSSVSLGIFGLTYLTSSIKQSGDEISKKIEVVNRRISDTEANREALREKLIELQWSVNGISTRLNQVEAKLERK